MPPLKGDCQRTLADGGVAWFRLNQLPLSLFRTLANLNEGSRGAVEKTHILLASH